MDATDIAIRLIGLFYVFAGIVGSRAMLSSLLMDRALSAIGNTPAPRGELARTVWLMGVTLLVLYSGAALVLGLKLASYLFVVSVALQAFYFFVAAPRYFDVHDAPDAQGRSQSMNAFIIFTLATCVVLWAHSRGILVDSHDVPWPALALAGALAALQTGYVIYTFVTLLRPGRDA